MSLITVKNTDTQKLTLQNCEVGALMFNAVLLAAVAGTAISGVAVDLSKIRVKAILSRAGEAKRVIYNEQLLYHAFLDAYFKGVWPSIFTGLPDVNHVLLANAGGVVQKSVLPILMNFGKTYVLRGQDTIEVEINTTGFVGASVDTASYLEVFSIDDENIDNSESEVLVYNIQAAKGFDSINLGNGVTDIMFLNIDKTSILDASAPLSSISIASKQLNMNSITQNSLIGLRNLVFETPANSALRYQNFMIHTGYALDECKLDLSLVAANVNASKCFIVYRKQAVTPSTIKRGMDHEVSKQVTVLKKAGLPSIAAKVVSAHQAKVGR